MKPNNTFIACLLLLTSCGNSALDDFNKLINKNSIELKNVCNQFIANSTIYDICIAKEFDTNKCSAINSWSYCGGKWETWDYKKEQEISLFTKDSVLNHEHINAISYNKFVLFLKKHKIETIARFYNCDSCVTFENGTRGLLYTKDGEYILREDSEYIWVSRVNKHFYLYQRDWN